MSGDVYQVVAECAHVTMNSLYGRQQQLVLKGALVPADAPELPRLLAIGYVAKTSSADTGGLDADGVPAAAYDADVPSGVTSTPVAAAAEREAQTEQVHADQELAEKRATAAAKLPADGSAPAKNAAAAVWVEYLAGKGYSYDELIKQDKSDLLELGQ